MTHVRFEIHHAAPQDLQLGQARVQRLRHRVANRAEIALIARRCAGTFRAPGMVMRLFVLAILLIGCATTPRPEPKGGLRGLRASEHLDAARDHDQMARERETWPDVRPAAPGNLWPVSMPWYRSWDTAGEHGRLAEVHRAKAAEIHGEYDEACRDLPTSDAQISPLQVYGISGWNTATGVIFFLSPDAGPPDRLIARMKCHRAAMLLAPSPMEDCPLDLPDIALDARGDEGGVTVSIVVRNPDLVPELQRRAAHDLEAAVQLRSKHP